VLRISWAIALSSTIAALVGILIVTRDLAITRDIFADGLTQAQTIETTTDQALSGAAELDPARRAAQSGLPEVVGVINSLTTADHTLAQLGTSLDALARTLADADAPLVGIIEAGQSATDQANAAAEPAAAIAHTLGDADAKARALAPLLDDTLALGQTIDAKLRIALLLPKIGE
jgi:hypothetical protein